MYNLDVKNTIKNVNKATKITETIAAIEDPPVKATDKTTAEPLREFIRDLDNELINVHCACAVDLGDVCNNRNK